jgi:bacterioferritin
MRQSGGAVSRSHSEYAEDTDLVSMVKEDVYAERIAIESHSEIARLLGSDDSTTKTMIEEILKARDLIRC